MKGHIPDLSKPSPIRIALRERREKSIAEGDELVARQQADEAEFAEIERQMG